MIKNHLSNKIQDEEKVHYFDNDRKYPTNRSGVDSPSSIKINGNMIPENIVVMKKLVSSFSFISHFINFIFILFIVIISPVNLIFKKYNNYK